MADTKTKDENKDVDNDSIELAEIKENELLVERETYSDRYLIYGINDNPPIHITIVCALQQSLLSISGQLVVSFLVAQAICASNDDIMRAKLLSNTLFMNGVTTVVMNLFGIRLPLFQGAAAEYVIPLLIIGSVDHTFCSSLSSEEGTQPVSKNITGNASISDERIYFNIQTLSGSLMVAGVVHTLLGFTGLVGILLKYVGPLTIVPTLVLIFIASITPLLTFIEVQWGIALSTVFVAVILSLYLSKRNMPVPVWTPSQGFRIIRYPLHQVFSILISIVVNWLLCAILTYYDVFPNDPSHSMYNARTDARSDVINDNPWVTIPYPGQFGTFRFSGPAFLSCMIATLISVLDSVGDYYACARVTKVPAPPKHAVNRGILVEGVCSFISGVVGCGHATNSYGGNIGAIGVTKVASRRVFVCVGIIYMLFGIFGKFSAFFITIPYPVLGGSFIVMYGIYLGVVLSNLEITNMSSSRNMAIIGISIFIGLSVRAWVQKVSRPISTGNESVDNTVAILLGNPNFVGSIVAFVLDNTVAGTDEERGMAAWTVGDENEDLEVDKEKYNEGYEVYQPLLPSRLLSFRIMKYIPFMPYKRVNKHNESRAI